jgi:hypothetical protein
MSLTINNCLANQRAWTCDFGLIVRCAFRNLRVRGRALSPCTPDVNHPIVSTLFANAVLKVRNGAGAGPLTTRPLVANREPWQGQT